VIFRRVLIAPMKMLCLSVCSTLSTQERRKGLIKFYDEGKVKVTV